MRSECYVRWYLDWFTSNVCRPSLEERAALVFGYAINSSSFGDVEADCAVCSPSRVHDDGVLVVEVALLSLSVRVWSSMGN